MAMGMKYRKKPIVIEAMQFTDETKDRVRNWMGTAAWTDWSDDQKPKPIIKISTLEGTMTARFGDWIIKGVAGEFYPCKPDIFEATYEAVENDEWSLHD